MYERLLKKPAQSILLLGPRGTGKSSWIKAHFGDAVYYDFLKTSEVLRLERQPDLLYDELKTLPADTWVVLDEVQKVPALLNEVQRLIEGHGLRFILCGSSARKFKRSRVNLLAGRAIETRMFPLVYKELGADFDLTKQLQLGCLPMALTGSDPEGYLHTYANTYLQEEIRAEAVTRNIGAFSRFLEVAARQNGQVNNLNGIARDVAVPWSTVQNYFQILEDTLIGYWLKPWKLKSANKQVTHPKFFFFDHGLARALSGRLAYPPTPEETGGLLETFLINEIMAYLAYHRLYYKPCFWRSYDQAECDLVVETRQGHVAIEIKAADQWLRKYSNGLRRFSELIHPQPLKKYGVFRGPRSLVMDDVRVLTVEDFLCELWEGRIIV
jgi:uncharacterized protein